MRDAFLFFHLNLAFSSVAPERRPEVITRCYHPLLDLAEHHDLPVGVELSGWTLTRIAELDPAWIRRCTALLAAGRIELIGSGWTQLIGPLAPAEVNRHNQRLGREACVHHLGVAPQLALVNEMAWADSLVGVYADAGYQGLLMDRDNIRLAQDLHGQPMRALPTAALGPDGRQLPVLWTDSNLFQNLQRAVHGDRPDDEYLAYVEHRAGHDGLPLPIYCNDAEVFDFRPGRFHTETAPADGEWQRLATLCQRLRDERGLQWRLPSQALRIDQATRPARPSPLGSIAHPVPVKKQAKYNLNRWSVTGRDDLWLNSQCHQLTRQLMRQAGAGDTPDWALLCELWASDLRTHITDGRWQQALQRLEQALTASSAAEPVTADPAGPGALDAFGEVAADGLDWQPLPADGRLQLRSADHEITTRLEADGQRLRITLAALDLTLDLRRGLTLHRVAWTAHDGRALLVNLPQGHFDGIALAADFYSGGLLMEVPGSRQRLTDLERVQPRWALHQGWLLLGARLPLADGGLDKRVAVRLHDGALALHDGFDGVSRPLGTLRVGQLTLGPDAHRHPLSIEIAQGGPVAERLALDRPVRHGQAVSALVSSSGGFGGGAGQLRLHDSQGPLLDLRWDPARCAAQPMLTHEPAAPHPYTRLGWSLCELDDTSRPGGRLRDFTLLLQPAPRRQA
ncbi:MAG: hypothetical protein RL223_1684 [Pseudomonadota bacterium]